MFKWIILVVAMLVASPASAAFWSAAWTNDGKAKAGQSTQVVIGSESISTLSNGVFCASPSGCTVRVQDGGVGSYSIYALVGRSDSTTEASYEDTGSDLASGGTVQYIDLTWGYYAFYADVAGTASGLIELSGN